MAAIAGMATASLALGAAAQDLRGPRNLPPPGYTGQQYVDSGGCVFLKAGLGGRVNWVPRIGGDRRQLCGYPPSFGPLPPVAVAEAPAPSPAPVAVAPVDAPVDAPPPAAARVAAPRAPAAPPRVAARSVATPGCPDRAPFGQRRVVQGGGTALFCAATADRAADFADRRTAAAAPVARAAMPPAAAPVAEAGLQCPALAPNLRRVALKDGRSTLVCFGAGDTVSAPVRPDGLAFAPVLPRGYRLAWTDGRLNPRRAQGTAAGQAAQDLVWTRDVPAILVATEAPATSTTMAASNARAPKVKPAVSTGNASVGVAPPAAAARIMVQIGSFGIPSNAAGAKGRLAALGLPVTQGRSTMKGKPVTVVYAGPFASAADAQRGLAAARRAGFTDAFVR